MQDMHRREAGILRAETEYNQKALLVHTPVDFPGWFSTPYPVRQRQAETGFELVFHSFHTPYC